MINCKFCGLNLVNSSAHSHLPGCPDNPDSLFKDEDVFVVNSTYARHLIKKRVLRRNMIEYRCSVCKIGPQWCGKPMPLILDHINGINNDNRLDNLRFVCSNCDCQLDTYKAKNKGVFRRAASLTDLKSDDTANTRMVIDTASTPPI